MGCAMERRKPALAAWLREDYISVFLLHAGLLQMVLHRFARRNTRRVGLQGSVNESRTPDGREQLRLHITSAKAPAVQRLPLLRFSR